MSELKRCQQCGNPIPQTGDLAGRCPHCMLELAFESWDGRTEPSEFVSVGTGEQSAAALSHSRTIGRYRILGLIGEGGMGAVYEAEQDTPRRTVALKIIRPAMASPELLRRFEQEAEALGRLQHPGIAQIYEAGTVDTGFGPQPYFAMEFVGGRSPREYAEAHNLTTRDRLEMLAKICDGVHHAHQRGLIHRDLKPGNILVDNAGQPKILDFGVARVTDSDARATMQTDVGQLVGTLAYMSPEQALADPLDIDIRTDVYALGVILYELLSGQLPYPISKKIHETIQTIREQDPMRLSAVNRNYRGDIETIVAKALEKDRARRYASAAELAADIHRYLRDEPIVARPAGAIYHFGKFARRHKALVAGVAAVFFALTGGIVASRRQASRARSAERAALQALDRAKAAEAVATDQRNLAVESGRQATAERNRAQAAEAQVRRDRDRITGQSLARESVRLSGARTDDDLAALLARQALLLEEQQPAPSRSALVENALQQASRLSTWSHNILESYETDVYSVAYSADGARLAAGGSDKIVRVWDLRKRGAPPMMLLGHDGPVSSVAFSPDGQLLASGGGTDNTVRIWDLRKRGGEPIVLRFAPVLPRPGNPVPPPQGKVSSVTFSPDGEHLAAVGFDTTEFGGAPNGGPLVAYTLRVWNLRTPASSPTLIYQGPQIAGANTVSSPNGSVAFSPDGARLAADGGDRTVRVWDLRNPGTSPVLLEVPQLAGSRVYSVAFTPDGTRLASASGDRIVRMWDLRNVGAPPVQFEGSGVIKSVGFSRDGARLASGSSDAIVRIWNLERTGTQPLVLQGHQASVNSVAFSPDGARLASGGSDKTLRLWDLNNADSSTLGLPVPVSITNRMSSSPKTSVSFSPDGVRLAAGGPDNTIRVWDLRNPGTSPMLLYVRLQEGLQDVVGPGGRIQQIQPNPLILSMAFSPDGARLATSGMDNFMRLFDLRKPGASPVLIKVNESVLVVYSVAFSPDGSRLAASNSRIPGRENNSVRLWDSHNPAMTTVLLRGAEVASARSVAFSPDGARLAAGSSAPGTSVQLWDLRNPGPPVLFQGHQGDIPSVAFSPDGTRLATGSSDGTARIWVVRSPDTPAVLLQDPATAIHSVAFSPDGARLAIGSSGGVRVFDLHNTGAPPVVFETLATTSVAFSPDGTRLAAGRQDGSVRLWPLWSAAADYLCTRVGRNLSMKEWRQYIGEDVPYKATCPALPRGAGDAGTPK